MWDIAAAVVASMGLGYFWYSPSVFGKKWFCLTYPGKKFSECDNSQALCLGMTMLANVGTAVVMQTLAKNYFGVVSVEDAAKMGLLLSALSVTVGIPHAVFGGKPATLFAIDKGFDVTLYVLVSVAMALAK